MRIAAFLAAAAALLVFAPAGCTPRPGPDEILLRIGSGHSTAVAYAGLMQGYFQPELARRVALRTRYRMRFVDAYAGSVVKVSETLEGVQTGILDIGGLCFCFEPSNLPLHAFQVMLPFGPSSPVMSMQVARQVYAEEPFLSRVFEERFHQKLVALVTQETYDLGTSFPWSSLSELRGRKLAGAGLNLNWLRFVGATPVQSNLTEAYTSLRTHVYGGWIMFPDAWVKLKLYEPAPHFTTTGFGSITWTGVTIHLDSWRRLPEEVRSILLEVGRDLERRSGEAAQESYARQLSELRERGADVRSLSDAVRAEWAQALARWPAERARELDARGLPASRVLNLALAAAEQQGYAWPHRYGVP